MKYETYDADDLNQAFSECVASWDMDTLINYAIDVMESRFLADLDRNIGNYAIIDEQGGFVAGPMSLGDAKAWCVDEVTHTIVHCLGD